MLKIAERALLVVGSILLAFCVVAVLDAHFYSAIAVARFHSLTEKSMESRRSTEWRPDFSLWDKERVREYETSAGGPFEEAEAVLRIDRVHLVAPVFNGTDELTLNRGAGRIIGTAHLDGTGNVGIAGHRDGFFRALKDVNLGDSVRLETRSGERTYIVDGVEIVAPADVSVLASNDLPSLTLVTCYPFYFVGSAPQRYIIHAHLDTSHAISQPVTAGLKNTVSITKEQTK